jgi:signal peptide peptidase SppA
VKGARFLAWAQSQPWAILPATYTAGLTVVERWARGEAAAPTVLDGVRADAADRRARRASGSAAGGAVAVIPIYGVLTQRGNMLDEISGPGSTSTQMLSASLREAIDDDAVSSILLDIDSPGGSVYGISELGDEIYQARSKKPITAIANSLAASAAYWLGTQANELYVTPSGEVGSIGVILAHEDRSKANEKDGVKVTYITAGKYKSEGNPNEPLSDEAKDYEQSRVDDYYGAFTKAVSRGRGVGIASVRNDMGQGRVLGADAAMAAKMVDGIRTFDAAVSRARQLAKGGTRASAASNGGALTLAEIQHVNRLRRLRIEELQLELDRERYRDL